VSIAQTLPSFASAGWDVVRRVLAVDRIDEVHARAAARSGDADAFLRAALDGLDITFSVEARDVSRIPKTGSLVVVANHPMGGPEGMILPLLLRGVRKDVKVLANHLLGRIEELRELFLLVDPFETDRSSARNVAPLRAALRHLQAGGCLIVFPAGEVASLSLRARRVTDRPWSETVARLTRLTRCGVMPVFVDGRNSALFHTLGLIHPRLRTAMLCRELLNKRGRCVRVGVGSPIPFARLSQFDSDEDLTAYLRQRTFMLRHRATGAPRSTSSSPLDPQPVIAPLDPALLAREIDALPQGQAMIESDDLVVYHARAAQIPAVLRELGRLREIAFRAISEGTGRSCDLDSFDEYYVQLFIWNRAARQIVGAYRLGRTDEILPSRGPRGLYTSTLFDYDPRVLARIAPALELGRSFVRGEYQRSYQPLLLLWRGIGQYIVRHPRYRHVFGPVSISDAYGSMSKQLMVQFLRASHLATELARFVTPRNPVRASPRDDVCALLGDRDGARDRDIDGVSDLVSDLESDRKGIPVLLRQYLKLGARLLAFNVDRSFGNCVDALLVADLTRTDGRMLDRYMGRAGREQFLAHHAGAAHVT
jgi:putative hemolysin